MDGGGWKFDYLSPPGSAHQPVEVRRCQAQATVPKPSDLGLAPSLKRELRQPQKTNEAPHLNNKSPHGLMLTVVSQMEDIENMAPYGGQ